MRELFTKNPWCLGLSLLLAWTLMFTIHGYELLGVVHVAVFYFTIAVCMGALALFGLRGFPDENSSRRKFETAFDFVASCVLMLAAILMLFEDLSPGHGSLPIVCISILAGLGISWGYTRWFCPLSLLKVKESVICMICAVMLSAVLVLVFGSWGIPAACICLFVLSAPIFVAAEKARAAASDGSLDFTTRPSDFSRQIQLALPYLRISSGVAIFSFAIGVSWSVLLNVSIIAYISTIAFNAVIIVICIITLVWIIPLQHRFSFYSSWRVILLLISAAILIAGQTSGIAYSISISLVPATQTIILGLWFLSMADITRKHTMGTAHILGMGWFLYAFPLGCGILFGLVLNRFEPLTTLLPALTVLALIVVAFVSDDRTFNDGPLFDEGNDLFAAGDKADQSNKPVEGAGVTTEAASVAQSPHPDDGMGSGIRDKLTLRCMSVARKYKLTNREYDVLVQLAHGRSTSFIASDLCLSENTVKGHVKRLYNKLGIHNRQELINLAESATIPRKSQRSRP